MSDPNVVIIGASLAGLAAAEGIRRGGGQHDIVVIGDEPWLPYDRPPLSKEVLRDGPGAHPPYLRDEDAINKLRANWLLGLRATALDVDAHAVELDDGSVHHYDKLIIATGARARTVPAAEGRPGLLSLRTFDDCVVLAEATKQASRVVIVGGGFIGCELAATLLDRGLEVIVVEMFPTLLAGPLGTTVGEIVTAMHVDRGITVVCGQPVVRYLGDGWVRGVELGDGRRIEADFTVIGLGAAPNIEWLESSGISLGNGVNCDEFGRTSAPDVYVAGDAACVASALYGPSTRIEHWTNASVQGAMVGANIVAPETLRSIMGVPYFWSEQHGHRLQYTGLHQRADDVQVLHTDRSEPFTVAVYHRAGLVTAAFSVGRPRLLRHLRQSLGQPLDAVTEAMLHAVAG